MAVQLGDERRLDAPARRAAPIEIRFNPWWSGAAILSLAALAVFAPSGLYLIGFLGVIIVAHEAGHHVMARRAGMTPTEFFWGFGPEVVAVQVGGCRYGIKALFLGGYVRLEGMTPGSTVPENFDEAGTFRAASHGGRLLTILAGPAVNLVMAFLAFSAAAWLGGSSTIAGLGQGMADLWYVIAATGEALAIWAANVGGYWAALIDGSGDTAAPVRFLSPVAQADVSRRAVGLGLATSLQWFAILSAAIGAINLLPLPPLDGSHAAVAASEWVWQRVRRDRTIRFDVARLLPLAYLTVGLLVALSVSALVLDIRDLL
ncbi:MAG: site-2 protease family protein [Actinomycetota bacterium]